MSFNRVVLMGRLGAVPELRKTKSDKSFASLSLATTDGVGENQKTNWHNIRCWNKSAESAAKYLEKGSQVLVEGSIEYGEYEKDGVKRKTTNIVCLRWTFADTKPKEATGPAAIPSLDDIPF